VAVPQVDPDTISEVYEAYLALRRLRRDHETWLQGRGQADLKAAHRHGYVSLPKGYKETAAVLDALEQRFGADVLAAVPGFYRARNRLTTHTARSDTDGFVIPYRDERGRIIGMQRRLTSGNGGKYQTFVRGGDRFLTVAGPEWANDDSRVLLLVDGGHKAHVAAELLQVRVVGLPGSNLNDGHLQHLLRLAPDVVVEALDADKFSSDALATARGRMLEKLHEGGFEVVTAVWEIGDGKGLDDLAYGGVLMRLRSLPRPIELGERRPYAVPFEPTQGRCPPLVDAQAELKAVIEQFVGEAGK
jgi:hypothetical protein